MSVKLRYFTVEEAESFLPQIVEILDSALDIKTRIENKVEKWRESRKKGDVAEEALLRGQVDYLASQLERRLGEITELGCIPKDLDLGLVDFAARINGKEAYLCWKKGEAHIRFWHGLTDGYKGRLTLKESDLG